MDKLCVVTVVDTIAATSMPINEFVLFRAREGYGFREVLIVCDDQIPEDVIVSESVEVHLVGSNKKLIRKIVGNVLKHAKSAGGKCVFHMHAQKSALLFLCATVGLGIRKSIIFTIHSTFSGRDIKYKLSSCICTLWSYYANCVSHSAYNEYASWLKRVKGGRLVPIPNGVDFMRIEKALEGVPVHNCVANRKSMVCVGRIIPIKNQQFIVRLLADLPDYSLTLVGSEDGDGHIRRLAESLGVADRVVFTGLVSRDEVFRRLNGCGLYVSSSMVEGLPVSVLEAMSVGLVPVLSNIDPHKEIADSCGTFNTLPLDKGSWIRNIRLLETLSHEDFWKISESIKEFVRNQYSLAGMHERYIHIYKQIAR